MYVLFDNGNLGQEFGQLRDSVDTTLNSWSHQTMKDVQTELSAVEAIKDKTDVDKRVHHDLKKIKEVLDGLLAKWDGGKLTKDPQALFADEVGSLPYRVKSLLKALKYAYWNLPHEADAYQVGGLVGNMINLSRRQQ
jgi:hypothetical protein